MEECCWSMEKIISEIITKFSDKSIEEDYVDFGDVARKQLGIQSQYASRYLDGVNGEYPNLGKDLRISGDPRDYHRVQIHKDDVAEFVKRYKEYQKLNKLSSKSDLTGAQRSFIISSLGEMKDCSYQEIASFYKKKYGFDEQAVFGFLNEQDISQKETPNREYPHEF